MDSSNEQLDRLNILFERLKSSQVRVEQRKPQDMPAAKHRLRNIQSVLMKFYGQIEQSNLERDSRLEMMTERLYKMQSTLQQDMGKRDAKEKALAARVTKIQKNYKKSIEQVTKQRNDMDKKIHVSLEACLADINNYRTKQQVECVTVIKELTALVPQVDELQQEVQGEAIVTKEILKKIYGQFSEQIDELRQMIEEEKMDRQAEEQALLKKLEETYLNAHNHIVSLKKSRERSEKMLVDLLERVIEKVKNELSGV